MQMTLRQALPEDRPAVELVESGATPHLRYLPAVFDEFVSDTDGEFSVAEVDGRIAGCGKFTVLPDGSAWLEALRVMPEYQGKGIGKAFYDRFFEIADRKDIRVMRMYTGVKNVVSRGLAERHGFRLAATFKDAWATPLVGATGAGERGQACGTAGTSGFRLVADPDRATNLLMPLKDKWAGFVVMNRTFYEIAPALCRAWAAGGKVYEDPVTGSVVALGARFMPEQALHLAMFGGDERRCVEFARDLAVRKGVPRVQCMFPTLMCDRPEVAMLAANGFTIEGSDYIVMQVEA